MENIVGAIIVQQKREIFQWERVFYEEKDDSDKDWIKNKGMV